MSQSNVSLSGALTATVRAHSHEVLDALLWRKLGSTAGHMEATLDLNPGLARLAADLPEGMSVRIVKVQAPEPDMVYLWD